MTGRREFILRSPGEHDDVGWCWIRRRYGMRSLKIHLRCVTRRGMSS
ncbi:MAG: hypothetical protein ACK559_28490 [bacterium]